jgi:hypothetical protein
MEEAIRLALVYKPKGRLTSVADVTDVLWTLRALNSRAHFFWGPPQSPHYRIDHTRENKEWEAYLRRGPAYALMPLRLPRRDPENPLWVDGIAMGSPLEIALSVVPYLGSATAALGFIAAIEKYWNAPLRIRLERAKLQKELQEARDALAATKEIPPASPHQLKLELISGSADVPDSYGELRCTSAPDTAPSPEASAP